MAILAFDATLVQPLDPETATTITPAPWEKPEPAPSAPPAPAWMRKPESASQASVESVETPQAAPIAISNHAFLSALFTGLDTDESLWVCNFTGHPKKAPSWGGHRLNGSLPDHQGHNTYFSVAALKPDENGKVARRKPNFSRQFVVVLDDTPPLPGIEPTWVLETSQPEGKSNTQVGFLLEEPIADSGIADRLQKALAAAGHLPNDKSGNNIVRYVRLPVGSNTKYSPPHPHHLLAWNPEHQVSLQALVRALDLDLDAILNEPPPQQRAHQHETHNAHDAGLRGESFFAKVNTKALGNLPAWVPMLFPAAKPYQDGYRIASADLGRKLEEDISILPQGARDFGEERGTTAIDLVIEWGSASTAKDAALWLCERIGIQPALLGWQDSPQGAGSAEHGAQVAAAMGVGQGSGEAPAQPLDPVAEAEKLRYIGPPRTTEGLFYGPIGEWSDIATRQSEASRAAVYITLVAYIGAALGRERFLWLDNNRHHPRINTLHVGRTGRGRKGTAAAPTERLNDLLKQADAASREANPLSLNLAPHVHTGGLSTREGIAWLLRDAVYGRDKDTGEDVELDPGEPDKRLWVLESEFDNLLAQSGRDGNTLSSALRDCFDGRDLALLTKTNRTRSTAPHVACSAHVTPGELLEQLQARAITNGFLNRFLVFWAERDRRVAFPERIPDEAIAEWARLVHEAIQHSRMVAANNGAEVKLTSEAKELYATTYLDEWDDDSDGLVVTALLERAPVVALRIALTLALLDKQDEIGPEHLRCGIAWTRYWRASVRYVWRERARLAEDAGAAEELRQRVDQIMAYLQTHDGEASRTDIIADCFKRHLKATELDAALEWAQLQTPPLLEVSDEITKKTRSRTYTRTMVRTNTVREVCEPCEPSAMARPSTVREVCEPCEPCPPANHAPSEHSSHSSHGSRTMQTRVVTDGSHSSHSSQGMNPANHAPDYEEI